MYEGDDEFEKRLQVCEERLNDLFAAVEQAVEESRRAIGRLDRAAEYCRRLACRLEDLEREHRQLATNVELAGGALITAPCEPGPPVEPSLLS